MSIEASVNDKLRLVRWADASVDQLTADYDAVRLDVTEEGGRAAQLIVFNHMGCRWEGHWDESIIETAEATQSSQWLEATLGSVKARYGEQPEPGGGTRQIGAPWFHLTVRFIDGAEIAVLGQQLEVNFHQGE
jgi:hypothetical protein